MPDRRRLRVLAALVFGVAVVAHAASGAQGGLSIRGKVVHADGRPAAGAVVTIRGWSNTWPMVRIPSVTTNSAGEFVFNNLFEGTFAVQAQAPCFAADGEIFELTALTPVSVVATLHRVATIGGRIWQPDGQPVRDARINVQRAPGGPRMMFDPPMPCPSKPSSDNKTDAEGRYVVHVAPGNYVVEAAPVDVKPAVEPAWFPGVRNVVEATAIAVAEGEVVSGIDFGLLPRMRAIVVQVTAPTGVDVRNLRLEYGHETSSHRGSRTVRNPDEPVVVFDSSFRSGPIGLFFAADSDAGRLVGFAISELTDARITEVTVPLGPPGELRAELASGVTDLSVARSEIAFRLVATEFLPRGAMTTIDGRRGEPLIAEGLIGIYRLEMPSSGWAIRSVSDRGRSIDWSRIEVAAGELLNLLVSIEPRQPTSR